MLKLRHLMVAAPLALSAFAAPAAYADPPWAHGHWDRGRHEGWYRDEHRRRDHTGVAIAGGLLALGLGAALAAHAAPAYPPPPPAYYAPPPPPPGYYGGYAPGY